MATVSMNEIKRAYYSKNLYEFVKAFWGEVEGVKYIDSWLVQYSCELFTWYVRDYLPDEVKSEWISDEKLAEIYEPNMKAVRKPFVATPQHLNVNMPPRHIKSKVFNVFGPTWLWTITSVKVASISHTRDLSVEMNRDRQSLISSQLYKEIFPERTLIKNQSDLLIGDHFGSLYNKDMNHFTGYGADIIVNDDLVSAKDAVKDMTVMAEAIRYYQNTMPSRLNNPRSGIIMNIQQRLAPGDVTGFILKDPELARRYSFVVIKAIATEDETILFPLSGRVIERKEGDPLWPERFGDYTNLKADVGKAVFETQYQQEPRASDDTIIKEEYIHEMSVYDAQEFFEEPDNIYISYDFPIKDKESSDLLGSVMAYKKGAKLLIVDGFETHMAYVKSKQYVINASNTFPGVVQIIEDKANGAPIIQELQSTVPGIIEYNPGTNSKSQRLESASVYMESKNVYFLVDEMGQRSEAIELLIDRLTSFPFVKHDDIVDAFSQLVLYAFLQKKFGIFSSSLTEKVLMSPTEAEHMMQLKRSSIDYAVVREGVLWKMLKVYYDITYDTFYILDEFVWRSDDNEALQRIREYSVGGRMLIDATPDNTLYNIFLSKLKIINNTDRRELSTQLSQINVGLAMGKIKINRRASEFRNDMDRIAYDKNALQNGIERLAGNEGLVACLRVIMYTVKGNSDFL